MKTDFVKPESNYYLAANLTIISLLAVFASFLILVPEKIPASKDLAMKMIILATLSISFISSIRLIKTKQMRALLQTVFVVLFFGYFYGYSSDFQFIVHNKWQDDKIVALDKTLFGGEVSMLAEKIMTPYITEVMMFSYIFYFPLLFIVAFVAYKSTSEKGLGEYLSILSLGIAFCHFGFILFPVASQMYYLPEQYSVILQGGWFTYLGELIRSNAHFPGGSLPSPHCTIGTVMILILRKNNRTVFYIILPFVLLLYASTVCCRYHYIWDCIIGIILGYFLVKAFPFFQKALEMLSLFIKCILHPVSFSQSLSD